MTEPITAVESNMVNVFELAKLLNVAVSRIQYLALHHGLPRIRKGRFFFYPADECAAWFAEHGDYHKTRKFVLDESAVDKDVEYCDYGVKLLAAGIVEQAVDDIRTGERVVKNHNSGVKVRGKYLDKVRVRADSARAFLKSPSLDWILDTIEFDPEVVRKSVGL